MARPGLRRVRRGSRGEALRLQELRLAAGGPRRRALRLGRLAEASAARGHRGGGAVAGAGRELLVTALAQAGRAGHALAAYADRNRGCAMSSVLTPHPRLRRLEQQVLQAELEPAVPARPSGPSRPRPERARSFVGREQELALVREALAGGRLVTWSAPAGVGKTAWPYRPRPSTGRSGGWTWPTRRPRRHPAGGRRCADLMSSRAARCWTHCVGGHGALLDCWSSTTASTCSPPWPDSSRSCSGSPPRCGCWRPAASASASTASRSWWSRRWRCLRRAPRTRPPPRSGCSCDRARAADPDFAAGQEVLRRVGDVCRALDGLPGDRAGRRADRHADHRGSRRPPRPAVRAAAGDTPRRRAPPHPPCGYRLVLRPAHAGAAAAVPAPVGVRRGVRHRHRRGGGGRRGPARRPRRRPGGRAGRPLDAHRPGHTGVGRYRMLETLRPTRRPLAGRRV